MSTGRMVSYWMLFWNIIYLLLCEEDPIEIWVHVQPKSFSENICWSESEKRCLEFLSLYLDFVYQQVKHWFQQVKHWFHFKVKPGNSK